MSRPDLLELSKMPSFTLKTPSTIKCVHILGSWDHYHRQVPLVKNEVAGNDFVWSSNFAFPFITLEPGKRYWYYVSLVHSETILCSQFRS